jgi:hypothetical protein
MKDEFTTYNCKKCHTICWYEKTKYPYCEMCKNKIDKTFHFFKLSNGLKGIVNRTKSDFRKVINDKYKILVWRKTEVYGEDE